MVRQGFLIDLYGFRAVISAMAPMILIIVHSLLAATTVSPIGPLVGQVACHPYLPSHPSTLCFRFTIVTANFPVNLSR